jgi:hypothetical protein
MLNHMYWRRHATVDKAHHLRVVIKVIQVPSIVGDNAT